MKELKLLPDDIPDQAKGVETIRRTLSNLGAIVSGLAEIRISMEPATASMASTGGSPPGTQSSPLGGCLLRPRGGAQLQLDAGKGLYDCPSVRISFRR